MAYSNSAFLFLFSTTLLLFAYIVGLCSVTAAVQGKEVWHDQHYQVDTEENHPHASDVGDQKLGVFPMVEHAEDVRDLSLEDEKKIYKLFKHRIHLVAEN